MVNAQLDVLELELRKLQGVRTVGFSTQHDVLYIQLFVAKDAKTAALPFEATRVAQRHSSSPVAVELVRWVDQNASKESENNPTKPKLASNFEEPKEIEDSAPSKAGSISLPSSKDQELVEVVDEIDVEEDTVIQEVELDDQEDPQPETFEEALESDVDLVAEETNEDFNERRVPRESFERIVLLTVSTSSDNSEIEVHLAYDEMRTIGRAPTNRGLLGAIDATVSAIEELKGAQEFHAEWARTLEPGPEHASLVAIGLTNAEGTDTRHGIAGGQSPIEAAARATLNALNRITELV